MATKIGSLFGDVSLRTAQLDKDIAGVGKKLKKLGSSMTALGKNLSAGLTAPLVAFGALSVKAFAEQEKAEASLAAALRASGQEVEGNMQKLKRMASEIQKVTTVGDEMSLALAQQAISMGLQADQMDDATRGAIGLSKAFSLDLKMAVRASSAALLGQTEMLTRYIPELKNIEDPAERVALVHQKMAEGFSLAEAEAETTAGRLTQLKNAFGDLQEQIGAILAEYLTPLVSKLQEFITNLQEADPAMVRLGVQIAAVAAVIGPALLVLGAFVTVLSSSVTWIIALGAGLGVIIHKMGILREAGELLGLVIVKLFEEDWKGALGAAVAMMWELYSTFNPIAAAADYLWDAWRPFWDFFINRAIDAWNILKSVWDLVVKIATAPKRLAESIGGGLANIAYRASGGPVMAGSPYIVGEEGPELFVPSQSGNIVPNHALSSSGGGGQTINMTFNGVSMEMKTWLKNNKAMIGKIAVSAVSENNLRTV